MMISPTTQRMAKLTCTTWAIHPSTHAIMSNADPSGIHSIIHVCNDVMAEDPVSVPEADAAVDTNQVNVNSHAM